MFFLLTTNEHLPPVGDDPEIMRLVKLARSGQQDAFEDLVFRFRDQVYATAWHLTRNTEDALDVTQDAFIRAYNALGSYKGRSRFSTWLHRIVLNTTIDYLRKEKRHRHISTDESAGADEVPVRQAEASVAATQRETVYENELHTQVLEALGRLSSRQRQVFFLRYFQGLNIDEMADVLKCTKGSVKRHLFRAQARLKELLSDLRMPDDKR